jgi:hypothetical protein
MNATAIYQTQVLPHNRFDVSPEIKAQVKKLYAQLEQDTLEYLQSQPETSASLYETLGRVLKEYRDVENAVCENQPYKAKWELLDLISKAAGEHVKSVNILRIA